MKTIHSLPPELWPVRDAVIERALANAPPPPDVKKLHGWLEDELYTEILAEWDDKCALDLKKLAENQFSDAMLRMDWGDGDSEDVTDLMRCSFARQKIESYRYDTDNAYWPSFHSVKLEREDGKSA